MDITRKRKINHSSFNFSHSSDLKHKTIADIEKSRTFAPELIKELITSYCNSIGY